MSKRKFEAQFVTIDLTEDDEYVEPAPKRQKLDDSDEPVDLTADNEFTEEDEQAAIEEAMRLSKAESDAREPEEWKQEGVSIAALNSTSTSSSSSNNNSSSSSNADDSAKPEEDEDPAMVEVYQDLDEDVSNLRSSVAPVAAAATPAVEQETPNNNNNSSSSSSSSSSAPMDVVEFTSKEKAVEAPVAAPVAAAAPAENNNNNNSNNNSSSDKDGKESKDESKPEEWKWKPMASSSRKNGAMNLVKTGHLKFMSEEDIVARMAENRSLVEERLAKIKTLEESIKTVPDDAEDYDEKVDAIWQKQDVLEEQVEKLDKEYLRLKLSKLGVPASKITTAVKQEDDEEAEVATRALKQADATSQRVPEIFRHITEVSLRLQVDEKQFEEATKAIKWAETEASSKLLRDKLKGLHRVIQQAPPADDNAESNNDESEDMQE